METPSTKLWSIDNVVLFLLISCHVMETVGTSNYSEKILSCSDLACANKNVCYTTTHNGTQQGHAHCRCRGEWAGLRCQSKLYVTLSSEPSATSVTLRIRGMTSSNPRKIVPMSDLFVTDFSVSFWNLNESSSRGCSIVRLRTITPLVTIKGLDERQEYMFCVANGAIDLCGLKSSKCSKISNKSNCLFVATEISQPSKKDLVGFIIVPIVSVIFMVVVIAIFYLKRRSIFVQFILHFFCCRKCHYCRKTKIRRRQHLMRKQRNVSGNFLLPPDPDQPLDDSMIYASHSFASNSALSAGNRSSFISDSLRSGCTPDSDDRFPSYLEDSYNPLYNPHILPDIGFMQPASESINPTLHSSAEEVGYNIISISGNDVSVPCENDSASHDTFHTPSDSTTFPHRFSDDAQTSNHTISSSHNSNGQNTPLVEHTNGHYYPSNDSIVSHNTLPLPPFYSTNTASNYTQFMANGNLRRQFSCPPEGKTPRGAVRISPQSDHWTRQYQYQGYLTRTNIDRPENNLRSSQRRRRPIIKRRPLSYDLDYHQRYLNTDFYTDDIKGILGINSHLISSSQDAFALATLPKRYQSHRASGSPRRQSNVFMNRSNSTTDSYYSVNTLPCSDRDTKSYFNDHRFSGLGTEDRLSNGSAPKDDAQSTNSYPESSGSKDEPSQRRKGFRSLMGQFERTLPFLRQNSNKNSTFCDDEFFRDLASPVALERRKSSKKKYRRLSQPGFFEQNASSSRESRSREVGVDPKFQGHPSQHVLLPFTTGEEEDVSDSICVRNGENATTEEYDETVKTSSETRKGSGEASYVISAFDDDLTNLVTPFITKKTSSEESLDRDCVTSPLTAAQTSELS